MTVAREPDLVDRPRAARLRSWFLPRKRDTLLIPAIALGICWAAVDAIPLDRSTEMVFILGVEADEVIGLLAGGLVAALLVWVWALARCWLKPSRRVLPSLIRVGISVPLI